MEPSVAAVVFLLCLAKAADTLELKRLARTIWGVIAATAIFASGTFAAAVWSVADYEAAEFQNKVVPAILKAVDWPPSTTTSTSP